MMIYVIVSSSWEYKFYRDSYKAIIRGIRHFAVVAVNVKYLKALCIQNDRMDVIYKRDFNCGSITIIRD